MAQNLTRNLRDGKITLLDGDSTPATLEIVMEEGNLNWTETDNPITVLDRGVLDHRRAGDQQEVDLSFGFKFREYEADSGSVSPADFINRVNDAAAYVSTSGAGEPHTMDVNFLLTNPDGTGTDETITFSKVVKNTIEFAEGDEFDTMQYTGKALMTKPTSARA